MKTHVLILSRTFPKWHPRAGEPTYFNQKLMRAVYRDFSNIDVVDREWIKPSVRDRFIPAKLHTLRGNYERWKKIIDEVRSGEAELSVREWSGIPYRSHQVEIQRFTNRDYISVQKLVWEEEGLRNGTEYTLRIDGKFFNNYTMLANNDGLSLEDWRAWFAKEDKSQAFAIIQFTSFRY